MSTVFGGDILAIGYNNPDLGTGYFYPIAGEAFTLEIGGFRNADDGTVDGAARLIVAKNRKAGRISGPVSNDMYTSRELEVAKALSSVTSETTFTIQHSNGITYGGVGVPVGDLELDTDKSRFTLTLHFGAGLAQV